MDWVLRRSQRFYICLQPHHTYTPTITSSCEEPEEYERQIGLLDEDVKQQDMERGDDDEEDDEQAEEEN
jgi:hypothetical protein